jgi:hypothetical protein
MPANTNPIFAMTPVVGVATLTSPTAVTSRANITGTTNLTLLDTAGTNGTKISQIYIRAKETTVAGSVFIWIHNGTTSFLFDEFIVSAVTASNTAEAFWSSKSYANLVIPTNFSLYVSSTIDQDFNIYAFGGDY